MKFFNNALVYVTLAASAVAAAEKQIVDNTKAAKSLRGRKKGNDRRRGLKGAKGGEGGARAWSPDPWNPDPWAPVENPDPWAPVENPDPWAPVENPDPWEPEPWNPDPWEPEPWYSSEDDEYPGDDYVNPDPWNPSPWEPEPEPWSPKKEKIQEWLVKKKAAKGVKGTKGDDDEYDPWNPDPWEPSPWEPKPPPYDGCKYFKIKLGALQSPSQETIPSDGGANVGAEFIYNSPLFEDTALTVPIGGTENPIAFVTGVCTRFQASRPVEGTNNTIAGAGSCDWTYTFEIEGLEGTLEVSGELFDSVKSTLSIVGGTNVFVGAAGQLELIPSPEGANIDIFTGVNYYNVSAIVYIKECEPDHWTWWKNHRGYWDWSGYGGGYGG